MNCNDVDRALITESAPLEIQAHVRHCLRCQGLMRVLGSPVTPGEPSAATLHEIERAMAEDLRPVRPIAPAPYFAAGLIAVFVCVVATSVYYLEAFGVDALSTLQLTVMIGALAMSAGLLTDSLAHQMIPGSRRRIPLEWLPVGIVISLAVAIAFLFHFQPDQDFWAQSWVCIRAGSAIAALAAVPIWWILRRGAILFPGWTGAAAGFFAGLTGVTALELHCPNLDAWHILVSHLGVAVLGAAVGLVVGWTRGKIR